MTPTLEILSSLSKRTLVCAAVLVALSAVAAAAEEAELKHGYAPVNGLKMYYEIHGAGGTPLLLLHGGGSTIDTTFGKILPALAKARQVIAFEQQGHGRTAARRRSAIQLRAVRR